MPVKPIVNGLNKKMEGISFTKLKRIDHPDGDIFHGLKASEKSFKKFGEAYFSQVHHGRVKAWKRHSRMRLNLIVPLGEVKFVFYDDRADSSTQGLFTSFNISAGNYGRLTVEPGIWFGFQGIGDSINLILNIADIEHDPDEVERKAISEIEYEWELA